MGKKRISLLGSDEEESLRAKKAVKLEQKKIREGKKTAKAPGLGGGQRVVDAAAESLAELEVIKKRSEVVIPETTTSKKPVSRPRSKTYLLAKQQVDSTQTYPLPEALALLRKISFAKFNPTVELHLNVREKGISFPVTLPHSTGLTKTYAVADEATLAKIEANKIDFDVLVASPAQMSQLTKFAKILGPRGLMPNPKTGTLAADPQAVVTQMKASAVTTLRTEKDAPLIHTVVGKLSLTDKALTENIQAILSASNQITKAVLKSTMSPGIKIAL
jgi:large subunit ribosomal protein L1